jgi:anti-sigma B factor antagonist
MNVELRTRVGGAYVMVALIGELDTTDAVSMAAAVMALASGGQRVIVDLGALEFIDCHAVSALLGVRQSVRRAGGDVLLAAPHGLVLRLLTLISVTGVHDSVAAAAHSAPAAIGMPPGGRCPAHLRTGRAALRDPMPDDGVDVRPLVPPSRSYAVSGPVSGPACWARR